MVDPQGEGEGPGGEGQMLSLLWTRAVELLLPAALLEVQTCWWRLAVKQGWLRPAPRACHGCHFLVLCRTGGFAEMSENGAVHLSTARESGLQLH